ncbi:hypothetical protein C4E15_28090 [Achromobacter spanius]|uniref:Uncharacterized protein n=1 Tax=Achromobacter spanius TaxID=217203 RepID=A0A2S5GIE8_9BURK|nr:hypothetical protein [Achromobacter spanius]PPA72827.1 hypothetical protein C4E15_28090 [Achromobacter spanius]
MTTKHTPGPWRIGKSYGAVVADVPVNNGDDNDHVEAYGGHLIAESIAVCNRPLIAAAPELLEALEKLNAAYDRLKPPGYPKTDGQKLADAAIAKARGSQ